MQSFDHQLDMCIKRETTFPLCVWGGESFAELLSFIFPRKERNASDIYILILVRILENV